VAKVDGWLRSMHEIAQEPALVKIRPLVIAPMAVIGVFGGLMLYVLPATIAAANGTFAWWLIAPHRGSLQERSYPSTVQESARIGLWYSTLP